MRRVAGCGGNQSDQVKESHFKKSSIVDFRVRSDYKIPASDKQLESKKVEGLDETLQSTR